MQLMPVLAEYYATREELAHILRYVMAVPCAQSK